MALNFPNSPALGQLYPQPAVVGLPVYRWDGEKWTTKGGDVPAAAPSNANPLMNATATPGNGVNYSREDHVHPSDTSRVAKSGDTMTGNLIISKNAPSINLNKTAASQTGFIIGTLNGVNRWSVDIISQHPETGGNAGTNFVIDRFNDAGAYIDSPFIIDRASGQTTFYNGLNLNTGNASFAGLLACSQVTTTNGFVVGGQNSYFSSDATNSLWTTNATCYLQYQKANGYWDFVVNNAASLELRYGPVTLVLYGQAYKPGGGSWLDSSDARIKNVIGDYKNGLEQIAKLRPVNFTFKGNDTHEPPRSFDLEAKPDDKSHLAVPYPNSSHRQAAIDKQKFIGLVAQDVERVLPEMVTKRKGYIDGKEVKDLRDLDTTPLIFALVNAIKELKARVEVLEGA